jgi:hypothetical protein
MFRLKENKDIFAFVLAVAICCPSICSAYGETNGVQSNGISSIMELITNCPPITNLVFKYTHGNDAPELYTFRTQSNAFYVHIIKYRNGFAQQNIECGHWNDDYWYYADMPHKAGSSQPPTPLYRYHFNSNDVDSIAYKSVNIYFLSGFRLFTSLGIAGDSNPYPIFVDDKTNITFKTSGLYKGAIKEISIAATLDYSNSLPVRTVENITTPDEKPITQYILYGYKSDIAEGRIPAHIDGGYFTIEVMSLSFCQPNMQLPKEYFTPSKSLLATPNLTEIVHSNSLEYEFSGGRLIYTATNAQSQSDSIHASQIAENALRSGLPLVDQINYSQGRRWYVLIIMFGFSAVALIVLIRGKLKNNKQ